MSHHHHQQHEASGSNIDRDERSVTKWLNTMEASLADPNHHPFSIKEFSPGEIRAINSYITSHEQYLARYDQFIPHAQVSPTHLDFGACEKKART